MKMNSTAGISMIPIPEFHRCLAAFALISFLSGCAGTPVIPADDEPAEEIMPFATDDGEASYHLLLATQLNLPPGTQRPGWLNPVWAAVAMVGSSLFVVTNSLRLAGATIAARERPALDSHPKETISPQLCP